MSVSCVCGGGGAGERGGPETGVKPYRGLGVLSSVLVPKPFPASVNWTTTFVQGCAVLCCVGQ